MCDIDHRHTLIKRDLCLCPTGFGEVAAVHLFRGELRDCFLLRPAPLSLHNAPVPQTMVVNSGVPDGYERYPGGACLQCGKIVPCVNRILSCNN